MQQRIWISFDLGIDGDYDGMYNWLDGNDARECGDGLATLKFEFKRNLTSDLLKDIRECVELDKRSRIYAVWLDEDKGLKGRFLVGRRKRAPWSGFAILFDEEVDAA